MRYLITGKGFEPFISNWFDVECHYNPDVDMIVYDLDNKTYTDNGVDWKIVEVDHL